MLGGNKFDLDKWDPEYFARRGPITEAGAQGIAVEVRLFNSEYPVKGRALAGFATPRALAGRVSRVTERASGSQLLMR
jgi:hypothetical protein